MKDLFDSTNISRIRMENRFIRSATWENLATEKGGLTPELESVYYTLAKGGVGMIITGYARIMESEQPNPGMMGMYDDALVDEYLPFTERIHGIGRPIVMQLAYGGSKTTFNVGSRTIWGPSTVTHPSTGVIPKRMTTGDIKELIVAFVQAGGRAKDAGFDGIQLHGAHGYLLSQFLSPYFNRRRDGYGGCINERSRIFRELLDNIRSACGPKYPVMIKINCSDFSERGATIADFMDVCTLLDSRGIDLIEVSGGLNPLSLHESHYAPYAAELGRRIRAPVSVVGKNRSCATMQRLLQGPGLSYFSLSRALVNDPFLISRWEAGERSYAGCSYCGKCFHDDGNYCGRDGCRPDIQENFKSPP